MAAEPTPLRVVNNEALAERSAAGLGTRRLTAGGALLARLKAVGVDYIFANSGTDFPPIIEGLAEAQALDIPLPHALVMPHEAAAMGMAHGYYLATGRAQAVMAHTNVGLANCAIGAINAATEQVPVLLFSGRTPTLEAGRLGSRTVPIGWGQEMRDQTALVREAVKWDYELRFPEQIPEMVDRAHAIATSTPPGPVYVSLPREILCETADYRDIAGPATIRPAAIVPSAAAIADLADRLARAEHPLVIAQRGCGDAAGFAALAAIAEEWAIPVSQYWAIQLAIDTDHPMSAGADPTPFIAQADLVIVLDSIAPWSPAIHVPHEDAAIVQIGRDPIYSRFPVRNFRSDLTIVGDVGAVLVALQAELATRREAAGGRIAARRRAVLARNRERRQTVLAAARAGGEPAITKEFTSLALSRVLADRNAVVLSELGCPLEPMSLGRAGSWYQEPHSGGLGWAFPAALGMSLADRSRLVVATMGDGSYIFSNAPACHQIAEALELPVLVLVLNNGEWGAVRQSVAGLYPNGYAARANTMPLTSLRPTPDFTKIAEASRAHATLVTEGAALEEALQAAIAHIETVGTHALVEIRIRP